jgi:hypothetical protein
MEEKMQEQKQEDRTVLDTLVDRRQFTLASAMAILSGVAITITSACGGGSSSPTAPSTPAPTPTPAASGDKSAVISSNHGHVGVITAAQLTAGNGISLDIKGSADHTHTVTLSAAEITSIAANQRVAKESTTDSAHSHTVTFN